MKLMMVFITEVAARNTDNFAEKNTVALEIERKFLVQPDWRPQGTGTAYVQGYLHSRSDGPTVRVRLSGDQAFLTIKGAPQGLARPEFQYSIPVDDAREMLRLFSRGMLIEKTRHRLDYTGNTWEVDVFGGRNKGLILAEVELANADEQPVLPEWVADEVSHDHRYSNAYLCMHPWPEWGEDKGAS
jgi:CYTH domain-containing protein